MMGQKFSSLAYGNCRDLLHVSILLFINKVNFQKKSGTSHLEISVSFTVRECDFVTTPLLSNLCTVTIVFQMVPSRRLTTKFTKFQTFSSKSSRAAVAYKRLQIQSFYLETFGILENCSSRKGCCLREVVATGGWTVISSAESLSRFRSGVSLGTKNFYPRLSENLLVLTLSC